MLFEKFCGAVLFTREKGEIRYVIIRSLDGDFGFPKGHVEPGETEHSTALREIQEEVGVIPTMVDGFRMETSYPLPNNPNITKQVVYFLAEYENQQLHPQPEEVESIQLMSFRDALEVLPFADSRRILSEAHGFLSQQSK